MTRPAATRRGIWRLWAVTVAFAALSPSSTLAAEATTCPDNKGRPEVIAVRTVDVQGKKIELKTGNWAELGGQVQIVLCNLAAWIEANPTRPVRLYLADNILPGSKPFLIEQTQGYVLFRLRMEPNDRAQWVQVLSEARRSPSGEIHVSVGDDAQPFPSAQSLHLRVYPSYSQYVVWFLVVVLIGLVAFGVGSHLLRVIPPQGVAEGGRAPFSLAYVQMACWFYLVIAAFLYVWLLTGEYNTLTESVLALIGISSATGLAAVMVDREKVNSLMDNRKELEGKLRIATDRVAEIEAINPAKGSSLDDELRQKRNEMQTLKADVAAAPPNPPPAKSSGFVKDILADGDGLSLHRFQLVTWTIVLIAIFIRSVYQDLAMPTFSATLLGLMGLSAGTYVGFKFPEKVK